MMGPHEEGGSGGLERRSPLLTASQSPPRAAKPVLQGRRTGAKTTCGEGRGDLNACIDNCMPDRDRGRALAWGGDAGARKVSVRPKVTEQVRAGLVAARGAHRQV